MEKYAALDQVDRSTLKNAKIRFFVVSNTPSCDFRLAALKCDAHGNKLLELCKIAGLCIFNGRVPGDENGACTTSKNTTIDYVLGTPQIIGHILQLSVENFDPIFSDVHNIITVTFKTKIDNNRTNNEATVTLNRWKKEKEEEFINNLNEDTVNDITSLLDQMDISVNDVNNKIMEVLLESATKTLGKRRSNQQPKAQYDYETRLKKRQYNRAKGKLKYSKTNSNIIAKRKAGSVKARC